MKSLLANIYYGFYYLLKDTKGASHHVFGAWWLTTLASLAYLMTAFMIGSNLVDKYVISHDTSAKWPAFVLLACYLFLAGTKDDHAWFGVKIDKESPAIAPNKKALAKFVAVTYFAIGLVLMYATGLALAL